MLLWKYPALQIGLHPLKKGLKRRVFGGMPLLLLEAQSAGEVAFSRDAPGHIAALHLQPGEGIVVREHQFLAATGNVQYDYSRIKGFANMLYGGGFFVDQFFAADHEGVVWIHGYGNVFEKNLEAGETIDIEPGGWVYRDHSVPMTQEVYGFKTGFLGGGAATSSSTASPAPVASACRAPTSTRRSPRARAATRSARAGRTARRDRRRPAGQLEDARHAPSSQAISRPIRCRPGSSAPSASAATSCSPTLPGWGRAGSDPTCSIPRRRPDPLPPRRGHPDRAAPAQLDDRRAAFTQLAAQLGYLRCGVSAPRAPGCAASLLNPAHRRDRRRPRRHPGGCSAAG